MPIRAWVESHLESILALVFGVGGSGVWFQIWDRRRKARAEEVQETIELSDEWRKLRDERRTDVESLRRDIESMRKQLEEQEQAIRGQRIRIRELESTNLLQETKNQEQTLEIARLTRLLSEFQRQPQPPHPSSGGAA